MAEMIGPCQLHVPYKKWAGDPHEEQNYEAIEQWSYRLPNCFKSGGGNVGAIHRVHYVVRHFLHAPPHVADGSTTIVYGDGSNHYANWAEAVVVDDQIDNGVFVPDNTSDPSIALLRVTASGILSWAGHIYWTAAGATGDARIWLDLFDDHNLTAFEQNIDDIMVDGRRASAFGGSAYIPADTWLEVVLRQHSGLNGEGMVAVTWTLLEA